MGAGLAALAGIVVTPIWGLRPHVGVDAVIPAFLIIVLGGIGSFWGAVAAGILVGLAVGLTGAYASHWSLLSMYLLLHRRGHLPRSRPVRPQERARGLMRAATGPALATAWPVPQLLVTFLVLATLPLWIAARSASIPISASRS